MGVAFVYLMTYGGSLVALFHPYIGLLIYVCFAIIRPESLWHWAFAGGGGGFSRTIAVALLIGWAVQGFGKWQFYRGAAVAWSVIAFMLWAVFGAMFAEDQTQAWTWVETLVKIVLPVAVGMTLIDSVDKIKQLAWVMVLSLGYVAYDLHIYLYFQGINRVRDEGFGGMDNNSVAIGMVAGVGFAFFLGLGAQRWWNKLLAFGAALLMAHVVLFSFSRGGMLGLLITAVIAFFLTPRRPLHYLVFGLGVAAVLFLAGEEVQKRFLTTFTDQEQRDESSESRLVLWQQNWELMLANPVFGVGPHHWPLRAPEFLDHNGVPWSKGKEGHSLWLQVGAELGFPGLGMLACYYFLCMYRLWPLTWKDSVVPDPWMRDSARMVFASLVGFAVSAQFVSLTFLEIPYYVALVGAGTLKLASQPAPATFGETTPELAGAVA